MNTEDTPKTWIGFTQSPVICHIPGMESFRPSVPGKYFNSDESPIIYTPQGFRLKDDQPQTIDFEIDLTSLGIPKGSLFMNLTLNPASHPEGISLSELADVYPVPAQNRPEGLTFEKLKRHLYYEINTEYPHQIWDTYFNEFVREIDNERVEVCLNGTRYYKDRIIAEHFIPNPDDLPDLEHINGNKKDNRIENLRRCSRWDEVVKDEWLKYDGDLSLFNINAPSTYPRKILLLDQYFIPKYDFG